MLKDGKGKGGETRTEKGTGSKRGGGKKANASAVGFLGNRIGGRVSVVVKWHNRAERKGQRKPETLPQQCVRE